MALHSPPKKSLSISATTEVVVKGSHKAAQLNHPIWAVNWFNTRSKFLSAIYVSLSLPCLRKVGAEILFKGHCIKKIEGKNEYDRKYLQIEKYPDSSAFLELVKDTRYRLLHSLYKIATAGMAFGFNRRLDNGPKPSSKSRKYWGSDVYLVHIFQADRSFVLSSQFNLAELAHKHGVQIFFSGSTEALFTRVHKNHPEHTPYFMDGLILFEGANITALTQLKNDIKYKQFQEKTSRSSLYFFKRDV